MKSIIITSLLALTGCSLYFDDNSQPDPTPLPDPDPDPDPGIQSYRLTKVRAIAGEHPIVGIDSDRNGGVWVAYRRDLGGFYDNDDVRVVHLDAAGNKLSEWLYTDEHTLVSGLAYADALWLSYNGASGHNHLRKLDPTTGAVLTTFATEYGIEDVARSSEELAQSAEAATPHLQLSSAYNEIITIYSGDGGEVHRRYVDAYMHSTQRGLTVWGTDTWVASIASKDLFLIGPSGALIGIGKNDILKDFNYTKIHLAMDSYTGQLLMHANNQIYWLAIEAE